MQPRVRYEHDVCLGAVWWEMRTQPLWRGGGGVYRGKMRLEERLKGSFNPGDRGRLLQSVKLHLIK